MSIFDSLIPIDMSSIEAEKRDGIKSFFTLILCAVFIGIGIITFSRAYAWTEGNHIALCIAIAIASSFIVMMLWAFLLFIYRTLSAIVFKNTGAARGLDNPQIDISSEAKSPFRPKATKEVEAFVVEYLTTHHQSWQWACLYSALLDSLMIDANQSAFYKYISSRYPELVNVKLRGFQHAVHENEEGARTNSSECEDEIERIKKELKNLA